MPELANLSSSANGNGFLLVLDVPYGPFCNRSTGSIFISLALSPLGAGPEGPYREDVFGLYYRENSLM